MVDPATGLQSRPTATVTATRAWLSQASTLLLGNEMEMNAGQNTVVSPWHLLCPLSVPLTSASTVTDETGRRYTVVGEVAARPDHRPRWWAAALHAISDMQ